MPSPNIADFASDVVKLGGSDSVPAICVRNLRFSYAGSDAAVLHGVDWTVEQGAFALLVGNTGTGKSTLLSLLKPEISPTGALAGNIEVFGRELSSLSSRESAQEVGYVFQDPENQIICESVWHEMAFGLENLGESQDEMRRRIAETCYFFGMDDWFRAETDTLSGGRKQLLALAATLVMRPRLLLLDEPTAMLDPVAEKNFLHALFRVNRELGCTVVVATHRPRPMLEYATCAFRMRGGAVEKIDDLQELDGRRPLLARDAAVDVEGIGGAGGSEETAGSAAFSEADLRVAASVADSPAQPNMGTRDAAAPALDLARAWFRYGRDGAWVLRNLDLSVDVGAVHALVGGNGCGKSTLLSIAAGTNKPFRGKMRRSARSCALLPQSPKALLTGESALEELMEWAGRAGYGEPEARAMLGHLGLGDSARRHPYDLSGGQQQLLALGKLLLVKPQMLLLDEPTKGLDHDARALLAHELRSYTQMGNTVLIATHDLDFVEQVADTVSMMFDGEIAATQPTAEFFAGSVFYRP